MNPKQFLLSTRLMGSLQSQQRPTWGCWTRPTFSPTHSSCSSAGDSLHPRYQYPLPPLLFNCCIFPKGLWQSGWTCVTSWAWGWYSGVTESPLDIKSLYNHQIKNIEWYFNIRQHFPVEFLLGCLVSPTLLAYIAFGISLLCRFESFFRQNCSSRKI